MNTWILFPEFFKTYFLYQNVTLLFTTSGSYAAMVTVADNSIPLEE